MIITVYALVADDTVSGSIGPDGFAFRTQRRTIKSLKQLKELYIFVLQVAWVDHNQGYMQQESDYVDDDATNGWNVILSGVDLD